MYAASAYRGGSRVPPAKRRKSRPAPPPPEPASDGRTLSGVPLKLLYTHGDLKNLEYPRDLGFPGEPPFTRGVYPTMYRGRLWTMREYAGFGSAEESNARYRYLLDHGTTGLSVAFDLPTQMGYDPDDPFVRGEVGKVGVPVSTIEDMGMLFKGIPLGEVSTSMTINATASILLALYVAAGEARGVPRRDLRGTVQNDILKEYIARSTYIYPPEPSMRLAVDIIEFCAREMPRWNAISVSGYHIREAGATAAQEVGFTLANGIAYVEACVERGLKADDIARQISFFFCAQSDVLEEVAKFRAARRLWSRIMGERFKARAPESLALRFHVQTAGVSLTAQQPENNVVRVAYQALAAVLGGAQSLHTNSMDEALGLPSEKAVRLALRTQQWLAHESGVANTVDPLGGSFYVEALTKELEEEAAGLIDRIDGMGGTLKAIEAGWVQREIAESAYRFQREVEDGKRTIVGVNRFRSDEAVPPKPQKVDPRLEREQVARVKAFRAKRSAKVAKHALAAVREAAALEGNLVPVILDAVKAKATLGEISGAMREIFGGYRARSEV
ncbi:MAG: methylmalonyl-CoA mutase [Methanobacteriota archaeon]|nr:MAG: methylmalonyl-CoA mutase [Euryarchaeota archaeon]